MYRPFGCIRHCIDHQGWFNSVFLSCGYALESPGELLQNNWCPGSTPGESITQPLEGGVWAMMLKAHMGMPMRKSGTCANASRGHLKLQPGLRTLSSDQLVRSMLPSSLTASKSWLPKAVYLLEALFLFSGSTRWKGGRNQGVEGY